LAQLVFGAQTEIQNSNHQQNNIILKTC